MPETEDMDSLLLKELPDLNLESMMDELSQLTSEPEALPSTTQPRLSRTPSQGSDPVVSGSSHISCKSVAQLHLRDGSPGASSSHSDGRQLEGSPCPASPPLLDADEEIALLHSPGLVRGQDQPFPGDRCVPDLCNEKPDKPTLANLWNAWV